MHLSYLVTSLCISSSYHVAAESILQVFIICKAFTSIFGNRKNSNGVRSWLYGGCSNISQWSCSRSKVCVCRAVCGRALSDNWTIPHESLPLLQDNLKSYRPARKRITRHLTVGGILNRYSHGHNYLCTYHVTRSDVQLHEAIVNITQHEKPMIGYNKTGVQTVCANVLYFQDGPVE